MLSLKYFDCSIENHCDSIRNHRFPYSSHIVNNFEHVIFVSFIFVRLNFGAWHCYYDIVSVVCFIYAFFVHWKNKLKCKQLYLLKILFIFLFIFLSPETADRERE